MDTAFPLDDSSVRIIPADAGGVPAEWVLAPNADPQRRLLYIHGGAWTMGSPTSHRRLTAKFSEVANAAVLAIDYRLMPEHPRLAGIEDCRTAWRWMLDHGPDGAAPASAMFVAGDSAGGNLTLSLIAWVRDQGLRAPNAAVALSPATDATLGSPSLKGNLDTDPDAGAAVQGAGEDSAHGAAVGRLGPEPRAALPSGGLAGLRRPVRACRPCWCRPARPRCCSMTPAATSTRPPPPDRPSSCRAGPTWCTSGSCSIPICPRGGGFPRDWRLPAGARGRRPSEGRLKPRPDRRCSETAARCRVRAIAGLMIGSESLRV